MKTFALKLIFTVIIIFFISKPALADSPWVINNFNSNINIEKSGKIIIEEKINLNFKTLEKHGIYRDIPIVYNQNGKKIYTKLQVLKIEKNDVPEKYSVSNNGNNLRIRIGDPNKTVHGFQEYSIIYSVIGVISSHKDFDEFYWNVTGNNWEADILHTEAKITLPENLIIQTSCYEGVFRSIEKCDAKNTKKDAAFSSKRTLISGEGFTIAVGFKKGIIKILSGKTFYNTLQELSFFYYILFFLTPIALSLFILVKKWRESGRDSRLNTDNVIVVEYESPNKLRPAEIGVLIDEKADTKDVTSTIIDLAERGFLTIREIKKSWMFGKNDYELTKKTKDKKNLLTYERLLLDKLFESRSTLKTSNLKYKFYKEMAKIKDSLYEELVNKNLFPKNPEKVRTFYLVIAIITIIISILIFFTSISTQIFALIALSSGILVSGLITLIFSKIMPRRTVLGYELYRKALGYKLFLDRAESYKQRFFESKNLINEVLPYTIAFGMTKKFSEAMKEIGLEKEMGKGFYHGATFNSISSSLDALSSSLSSAISSAPTSSGSGGGGSSGGGFGGGGGGSW